MKRDIDCVVENLKHAKDNSRGCSVLIGAGCSLSAGIPLAAGFVAEIKERFPAAYDLAEPKDYPNCMDKLAPGLRRDLILKHVRAAKINWAHIAIAQLMRAGFVDRVLTVNFDPLVMRACAMVDQFPSVYDFAASQVFRPADIHGHAIFHLHGQHSGFILLNTQADMEKNSDKLRPVFEDAGRGRTWIVVGYSGDNDPVFEHLAKVECFDRNLYWVVHGDSEPPAHVREKLLLKGKYANYVQGYDADTFFVTLAQRLDCFFPEFVAQPFSYVGKKLDALTDCPLSPTSDHMLRLKSTRDMIDKAVQQFESQPGASPAHKPDAIKAMGDALLMAGRYQELIALSAKLDERDLHRLSEPLAWAHLRNGNQFLEKARKQRGAKADNLLEVAGCEYEAALKIKPDMHDALNNWGAALSDLAETKTGDAADRLLDAACAKCEAALKIKPDMHEALYNWGNALLAQAETKTGDAADRLFEAACAKYEAALKIKPDKHEALCNWGAALSDLAKTKIGDAADRLFEAACAKYEAGLKIKPDMHEALNNWGAALSDLAKTKTGDAADRLFEAACAKYEAALKIKPDMHEALNNWGAALSGLAKTKTGEATDRLFEAACAKYEAALKIKPDDHETLCNWGSALSGQAETKTGEAADRLFEAACAKYEAALKIKPDDHELMNNWGGVLLRRARTKSGEAAEKILSQAQEKLTACEGLKPGRAAYNLACVNALRGLKDDCRQWLEKAFQAGRCPSRQHLEQDSDLDSVRSEAWFKEFLARLPA